MVKFPVVQRLRTLFRIVSMEAIEKSLARQRNLLATITMVLGFVGAIHLYGLSEAPLQVVFIALGYGFVGLYVGLYAWVFFALLRRFFFVLVPAGVAAYLVSVAYTALYWKVTDDGGEGLEAERISADQETSSAWSPKGSGGNPQPGIPGSVVVPASERGRATTTDPGRVENGAERGRETESILEKAVGKNIAEQIEISANAALDPHANLIERGLGVVVPIMGSTLELIAKNPSGPELSREDAFYTRRVAEILPLLAPDVERNRRTLHSQRLLRNILSADQLREPGAEHEDAPKTQSLRSAVQRAREVAARAAAGKPLYAVDFHDMAIALRDLNAWNTYVSNHLPHEYRVRSTASGHTMMEWVLLTKIFRDPRSRSAKKTRSSRAKPKPADPAPKWPLPTIPRAHLATDERLGGEAVEADLKELHAWYERRGAAPPMRPLLLRYASASLLSAVLQQELKGEGFHLPEDRPYHKTLGGETLVSLLLPDEQSRARLQQFMRSYELVYQKAYNRLRQLPRPSIPISVAKPNLHFALTHLLEIPDFRYEFLRASSSSMPPEVFSVLRRELSLSAKKDCADCRGGGILANESGRVDGPCACLVRGHPLELSATELLSKLGHSADSGPSDCPFHDSKTLKREEEDRWECSESCPIGASFGAKDMWPHLASLPKEGVLEVSKRTGASFESVQFVCKAVRGAMRSTGRLPEFVSPKRAASLEIRIQEPLVRCSACSGDRGQVATISCVQCNQRVCSLHAGTIGFLGRTWCLRCEELMGLRPPRPFMSQDGSDWIRY